jgi:perosamine synthetase
MSRKYIPIYRPVVEPQMVMACEKALLGERLILGRSVRFFEEEFSDYCGTRHGISTNSGTNALLLSLLASGIGRGDEVVTTGMSFVATANAIIHAGAKPVFADVENNGNISPDDIRKRITEKTKAIIPVHLHGYPCDMESVMEIADKQGLIVIEDACQAHGAKINGKKAGSIGHIGCFSFNPMKNMSVCGDGGMVVTDDAEIADMVRELSDTGRKTCYDIEHTSIGYTARLNTINAAIGRVQLRRLEEWNEKRRMLAKIYSEKLSCVDGIRLLEEKGGVLPAYNKYVVIVEQKRNLLMKKIRMDDVSVDAHFPIPIQEQPAYRNMGYSCDGFPNTAEYAKKTLSLPMFPQLKEEEIDAVCNSVKKNIESE